MSMPSNISIQKLELIQWLTAVEDSDVINKISEIKNNHLKDWWLDISQEEKDSILKGIKSADHNELIPHDVVRKR